MVVKNHEEGLIPFFNKILSGKVGKSYWEKTLRRHCLVGTINKRMTAAPGIFCFLQLLRKSPVIPVTFKLKFRKNKKSLLIL